MMCESHRPSSRSLIALRLDARGVAAVEFSLILPILVLVFFGTVTLFSYYRTGLTLDRATTTVADFMSRQTELSDGFMRDRVKTSLERLVPHEPNAFAFRVTSLTKTGNSFRTDWTYPTDAGSDFATRPIPTGDLPLVSDGDSVLLTETLVHQNALFDMVGAAMITHRSTVAVRPRFTKAIVGPH